MPAVTAHGGRRAVRCTPNTRHLFKTGWVAFLHQRWSWASGFVFKCVTLVKAISVFLNPWVLFGERGIFPQCFSTLDQAASLPCSWVKEGATHSASRNSHFLTCRLSDGPTWEQKKSFAHQIPQQKGCCSQGLNRKWDQGSIYLFEILTGSFSRYFLSEVLPTIRWRHCLLRCSTLANPRQTELYQSNSGPVFRWKITQHILMPNCFLAILNIFEHPKNDLSYFFPELI